MEMIGEKLPVSTNNMIFVENKENYFSGYPSYLELCLGQFIYHCCDSFSPRNEMRAALQASYFENIFLLFS